MKNVAIINDNIHCIDSKLFSTESVKISAISCSLNSSDLFLLTNNGVLLCFNVDMLSFRFSCSMRMDNIDSQWFSISFNNTTELATCISKSGTISQVKYELNKGVKCNTACQIRNVNGGIVSACWSADQNYLVVITNNNTAMLMSNNLRIIKECGIHPRTALSPCSVSWHINNEIFAMVSADDTAEQVFRVRLYNKDLEVVAIGRATSDIDTVDTPLKGLGHVVTCAPNGNYMAVSQQRVKHKHQVALLDASGRMMEVLDVQVGVFMYLLL